MNAVIRNGVLMIRVGGGFMTISEFVDKHAEKELNSLKIRVKKEKKQLDEVVTELVKKFKEKKFANA